MSIGRFILLAITLFSILSIIYILKQKYRKALLSFLSFQATTWLVSLLLVQSNQVSYPVRIFPKATRASFLL